MSVDHKADPKLGGMRSRRAVLAGLAGGAAAIAVHALDHPAIVEAAGADGAIIHVADTIADAQTQTTLANKANDGRVLWVASNSDLGNGNGIALTGYSAHKIGVEGLASGVPVDEPTNVGVFGYSPDNVGVWGRGGWGVTGEGSVMGVEGTSTTGTGASGIATTGTGVQGSATTGTGVFGYASSSAGFAIKGSGRVQLAKISGVTSIAANTTSRTISLSVDVVSTAFVLLSPHSNIGSRSLYYTVDATNNRITIHMSSSRTSTTYVAWLLLG